MKYSIKKKLAAFKTLQTMLLKFFFFIHANFKRQLYVNLNVSKKFDFDIIIYHVKES